MIWAVVMAGGSGTRFWPESRAKNPKQFLRLYSHHTLLDETLRRIRSFIPSAQTYLVTQDNLREEAARMSKLPMPQIIGEPVGRNTAPCAVLMAALIYERDPEAVIALLPADHKISKKDFFCKALDAAAQIARYENMPVTFGIRPTRPHTGYGYLELDSLFIRQGKFDIYKLKSFCEKPSLVIAKKFFDSKTFLWNSGIFVWRAKALLESARKYLPKVYALAHQIATAKDFDKAMRTTFPDMQPISIDYGLMEKMKGKILTLPLDVDWNDLGSWQGASDSWKADNAGNVGFGNSVFFRSQGNIAKAHQKRLVTLLGVKDLIVIDTKDALLVCSKESAEAVRDLVSHLREQKLDQYL